MEYISNEIVTHADGHEFDFRFFNLHRVTVAYLLQYDILEIIRNMYFLGKTKNVAKYFICNKHIFCTFI